MIISVLPIGPFDSAFSYLCDEEVAVGDIVQVPFGSRKLVGIVTDEPTVDNVSLKYVDKIFGYNIHNYDFLNWVASYTVSSRGNVLKMMLAEKTLFSCKKCVENIPMEFDLQKIQLNDEQMIAFDALKKNVAKPFLLEGVTGSGKTEVYLSYAQYILSQGKQVLILLPEISLTPQMIARVKKYFGVEPLVWNSEITPKVRREVWMKAHSGDSCVIIGARSALFLPFSNLGCIIVDEEQDSSYKQEDGVLYNARDMAVVLGKLRSIPVILSSATPSLESYVNVKAKKYEHAAMLKRYGESQLPSLKLIDMRQNKFDGFLSAALIDNINQKIKNHEQVLIYVNRRGYAPISLCKKCGSRLACPNCSTLLVYHQSLDKLICHYCGHSQKIPEKCVDCGEENSYIQYGVGVERVAEELHRKLPHARVEIASSDTISSLDKIESLMQKIIAKEVDIVIGTQILAKGHHFPDITLVGIVDGDLGLQGADIRSAERMYQLVNQVSGRAGRGSKKGEILVQTFNPEHPLYVTMQHNETAKFMEMETAFRKKHDLPPFSRLVAIIISGTNKIAVENVAHMLKKNAPAVEVFGPSPAPIALLRGRTRWRILLKSHGGISGNLKKWLASLTIPKNVRIQLDVDPINFL